MNEDFEIRKSLETLLNAWEGDANLIEKCVDDEPYAYFSIFGNGYTKDTIKSWFSARAKPASLTVKLINHVALIKDNDGMQYASVIGIFKDNGFYPKHLAFGGTFVNQLIKTDTDWKLKVIRFNLQCEDSVGRAFLSREGLIYRETGFGQPDFISNWKKIDDRIGHNMTAIPGTGSLMISPDYDTPWYVISNPQSHHDEETNVKDLLYKYCYAYDFASFRLLSDILDDNIEFTCKEACWHNRRDTIGFLKMHRKTAPRSHHSVQFESVRISGNKAAVRAWRIAPDLKTLREPGDDLLQWMEGIYQYTAVCTESQWRITQFEYFKN